MLRNKWVAVARTEFRFSPIVTFDQLSTRMIALLFALTNASFWENAVSRSTHVTFPCAPTLKSKVHGSGDRMCVPR